MNWAGPGWRTEAGEFLRVMEHMIRDDAHLAPALRQQLLFTIQAWAGHPGAQAAAPGTDPLHQLCAQTQHPVAYLLLAVAWLEQQRLAPAFATLLHLERQHAGLAATRVLKALIYCRHRRYLAARAQLQLAVQQEPGQLLAWRMLIRLSMDAGDQPAAALFFNEALMQNQASAHVQALQGGLHRPAPDYSLRSREVGVGERASSPARPGKGRAPRFQDGWWW